MSRKTSIRPIPVNSVEESQVGTTSANGIILISWMSSQLAFTRLAQVLVKFSKFPLWHSGNESD